MSEKPNQMIRDMLSASEQLDRVMLQWADRANDDDDAHARAFWYHMHAFMTTFRVSFIEAVLNSGVQFADGPAMQESCDLLRRMIDVVEQVCVPLGIDPELPNQLRLRVATIEDRIAAASASS